MENNELNNLLNENALNALNGNSNVNGNANVNSNMPELNDELSEEVGGTFPK